MQNIKNFKLATPSSELLEKFKGFSGIQFLESEDKLDWYESQRLFLDDTIKIQYNSDGVITSVVDAPVPHRGNTYAVSMLFPLNCSVAEIAIEDYPEGVKLDGTWKFDEETNSIYQDSAINSSISENTRKRASLASNAALAIVTLQAGFDRGISLDGDADMLAQWQDYLCNLRSMTSDQLEQSPAAFPPAPASIF